MGAGEPGRGESKPGSRRSNVRLACVLGLLALAFYALMFLILGSLGG